MASRRAGLGLDDVVGCRASSVERRAAYLGVGIGVVVSLFSFPFSWKFALFLYCLPTSLYY